MEKKGAPLLQLISLLISLVILLAGLALTAKIDFQGKCLYKGPLAGNITGPCARDNTAEISDIKSNLDLQTNTNLQVKGIATSNLPDLQPYQGKFNHDFELEYDRANMVITEEQDRLYVIPQNYQASDENIRIVGSLGGTVEMNQDDCESYYYHSSWFPNAILDTARIVASANGAACELSLTEHSLEENFQYQITVYIYQDASHNRTWELTKTITTNTAPNLDHALDQVIDSFVLY